MPESPNVFPFLCYRDAASAIEWLAAAFGFTKRLVVPGDDGSILHAELQVGPGVIMLASVSDNEFAMDTPRATGRPTGSLCIRIDDVDAHHARALAAGAEMVRDLGDREYGSRDYTARDPEGHLWTFGTYDPYASPPS